jgi:hypothetical protein
MPKTRLLSLLAVLLLSSCVQYSNQYAPDRARRPDAFGDPRGLSPYISMKDASAGRHFAGGLDPAAFDGEYRKAGPVAQFRFAADPAQSWKFQLKYRSASPQRLTIRVNGQNLGVLDAPAASAQYSAAVPSGVLLPNTAVLVEILSESGLAIAEAGFMRP